MLRKFACMVAVGAISLTAGRASANGQLIVGYDAKSLGMGLTGTAWMNNSAAAYANPAGLGGVKHWDLTLAASPSVTRARGPYATTINGQAAIAQAHSQPFLTPLGLAGVTYRPHRMIALNVAAGVADVSGAQFQNSPLMLLDGDPASTQTGTITQGSLIWDARANVALNLLPWLTIGGGYRMSWVHAEQALKVAGIKDVDITENGHNYGGGTAGFVVKPHRQVRIGGSYRSKMNMRSGVQAGSEKNILVDTVIDPHQFSAGVAWQLANNRVMLAADYKHWFYADAAKNVASQENVVQDAMSGHIGAEVLLTPMVPLRAGFLVGRSRTKDNAALITRTPPGLLFGGTVGTGLRFEQADLDLAFGYGGGATRPSSAPVKGQYGVDAWLIQASASVHI